MADVSELRRRRTDPLARYWSLILWGITTMLILALGLVAIARLSALATQLDGMKASLDKAQASTELATTRYDTEIRALHDIAVKMDILSAWYQEDARRDFRKDK